MPIAVRSATDTADGNAEGRHPEAVLNTGALQSEIFNSANFSSIAGTDNTARKLVEAEQKRLDQRLRNQQFYTRSLIESNIGALMTTDPSGIITDVNKQMEALTGCTRDELIGETSVFLPSLAQAVSS